MPSQQLIDCLNQVLADLYAEYISLRQRHWHLRGITFRDVHLFFDEITDEVLGYIDTVGEYVVSFGADAVASIGRINSLYSIPTSPEGTHDPVALLRNGLEATLYLKGKFAAISDCAEECNEYGVTNSAQDIITHLDKFIYKYQAFLQSTDVVEVYKAYRSTSSYTSNRESVYLDDGTSITFETTESIYIDEPVDVMIAKMNDDQHLVFGWANVSITEDGDIPLDWQGDVTAPQVLEKAAYQYVLKNKGTGEMHQGDTVGYLVESVMMTKQKMAAMGIPEGVVPEGWWIGFYVPDDEVVAKIKNGTYKMFSIQGKAKRLKV